MVNLIYSSFNFNVYVKQNTFFRRRASAPPHAFLFFSFLFFSFLGKISAQNTNYALEVCRVMSGPAAGPSTQCLPPGCFRYYYDVVLIAQSGITGDFVFDNLEVSAQLTVNGVTLATNPIPDLLSEINRDATEGCENTSIDGHILATEAEVSFVMTSDDNNPTNDPDSPVTIPVSWMPLRLFTIVVDAYPGETIDILVEGMWSYQLSMGNPHQPFQQCGGINMPTEIKFLEPPLCATPGACIEFGPVDGGYNVPAIIPVLLSNAASSYEEVDVLIDLSFDNFMEMPEIIPGDVPASDVEVFQNQSGGYSIYAHTRNVTNATGVLFRIKLNSPVFLSSGGSAVFTLQNGRYEPGNGNCCKPCLGAPATVEFDGFDDCTDDITLRVDGIAGNQCGELFVNVTVNWQAPPLQNQENFYKLKVVLDLDLVGSDISIGGLVANDIGCPLGGPAFCSESSCFTVLDDNTVQFCFGVISNPLSITNETGFRFQVNANEGFVNDVVFREAFISRISGGPGIACVPNILVDQADFPLANPLIAGGITRPDNPPNPNGPESVVVDIASAQPPSSCSASLPLGGCAQFSFCACNGNDYTVSPFKNDDVLNGVTTFDLVLIQRHILGTQLLDTPYKIIAADANKSNGVSTSDLTELRKLILFINENFQNNTSWRFFDKSIPPPYPIPFSSMPPEIININNLPAQGVMDADFYAVKVGDVNYSASVGACFGSPDPVEDRGTSTLKMAAAAAPVAKGGTLSVPFTFPGGESPVAFQAGICFDPDKLRFLGASRGDLGGLSEDNFGLTEVADGKIRMLWFSPDEQRWMPEVGDQLFQLHFEALADLPSIDAALWLDDAVLGNLAWDEEGKQSGLELVLENNARTVSSPGSFTAACRPNPFAGQLSFDVTVEKGQRAELLLLSAFGALVERREVELAAGTNTITFDGTALPAGAYNWKVRTAAGRAAGTVVKR